ncbi:uncharacterized protein LOC135939478 isoform X2 [Cloeon dipterum]
MDPRWARWAEFHQKFKPLCLVCRKNKPREDPIRRTNREVRAICNYPPPGIEVVPDLDDADKLHTFITCTDNTSIYLIIRLPKNYPNEGPRVTCMTDASCTAVFEPYGKKVLLSMLGTEEPFDWSPDESLESVLISIQRFLNNEAELVKVLSDLQGQATAAPIQATRKWHQSITPDLRNRLVFKTFRGIYPTRDVQALTHKNINKLIEYARKVEGDLYQKSTSKYEYYLLLHKITLEVEDKREKIWQRDLKELKQLRQNLLSVMHSYVIPRQETS